MRFTVDSNILVYALDAASPAKQAVAVRILEKAPFADAVLTAQALGEFLKVVRRKLPRQAHEAVLQASDWVELFLVVPTDWHILRAAAAFSEKHRLQFWDCVIWQAARAGGADIILSEDLGDGLSIEGVTVLNPFNRTNEPRIALTLRSSMPDEQG